MNNATKDDRLELRLTKNQRQEIEQAARISGRSVTEFSVSLLVDQARDVIRHDQEFRVANELRGEFNAILDRPAQPVEELAELLRRPSVFAD